MGQEITVKGREMIRDLLENNKGKFALALQNNIDPEHFCRTALTMIQGNAKLLNCTQPSLFTAVLQAAQLSLNLDGLLGQAYLVPYKERAVMIIGYKGLRELALRTEKYKDVRARVVYEKDKFEIALGTEEYIIHHPFERDRGKMRGCYSIAICQDGTALAEFMFTHEIEQHRDQFSQGYKAAEKVWNGKPAKKDSPWHTSAAAMWEKTLIRKLCGRLQMSVVAQQVMQREALVDAGLELPTEALDGVIYLDPISDEQGTEKPKEPPSRSIEDALSEQAGDMNPSDAPVQEKKAMTIEKAEAMLNEGNLKDAGKYQDLQIAIADYIDGIHPNGSTMVKQVQFNKYASDVLGKKGKYQADQMTKDTLERIWDLISKMQGG